MIVKRGKRLEYTGRDVAYFAELCQKSIPNEVWMWPVEAVDALVVFVHHKDGRKTDMTIAGRTRAVQYIAEVCATVRARPPHLFGTNLPSTSVGAVLDRIPKDWTPAATHTVEYDKPKATVQVTQQVAHTARRTRSATPVQDAVVVAVPRTRTRPITATEEPATVATTAKRTRSHDNTATHKEEDATCTRTSRRLRTTTNRAASYLSLVQVHPED